MKSQIFKIIIIGAIILELTNNSGAQDIDYARKIIDSLCSNEMAGRGYVADGHRKAASFIENEFRKIGVKPISNSYNQHFNISVNTFPESIHLSINDSSLQEGKDFIVDPASPAIKGQYEAITILPEHFKDETSLKQFLSKVKNKFIVFNTNIFAESSQEEIIKTFLLSLDKSKYRQAGIIIFTATKLTWHIANQVNDFPIIYLDEQVNTIVFDKIQLEIKNKFCKNIETQNVVGFIEGTELPDSFFVFTAHYDHLGMMGNAIFRGANDNASGIAMLLNLAKYFKENPLKYSIIFIAFGAEEVGLKGSLYYADNPLHALAKTKFLINIDLAGTGDEGIQVVNGTIFRNEFDKMKYLNDSLQLLPQVKIREESCNSDHCPFYIKKVPCFFIYTLGGIKAYHDIYDIPETLPLTEFEDYFLLLAKFVESF